MKCSFDVLHSRRQKENDDLKIAGMLSRKCVARTVEGLSQEIHPTRYHGR